jgi:hypothetical protein
MPSLYNCRHDGDQYRISKFDPDFNVESSYLCTLTECECPAGHRPTCRHRQMLPRFLQREHVGDEWFYDFDRGGWVQGLAVSMERTGETPETAPFQPMPVSLPEGVHLLTLDDPATVHNAIAEAVGEPSLELSYQPDPQPNITATEVDERIAAMEAPQIDLTKQLDEMLEVVQREPSPTSPPTPTIRRRV